MKEKPKTRIDLTQYKMGTQNVFESKEKPATKPASTKTKKTKKKLGRPTICNEILTKQISVKLPEKEYLLLTKRAGGVPLANYVRQLIQKDLGK